MSICACILQERATYLVQLMWKQTKPNSKGKTLLGWKHALVEESRGTNRYTRVTQQKASFKTDYWKIIVHNPKLLLSLALRPTIVIADQKTSWILLAGHLALLQTNNNTTIRSKIFIKGRICWQKITRKWRRATVTSTFPPNGGKKNQLAVKVCFFASSHFHYFLNQASRLAYTNGKS
jgi:hypothetical protein